MTLLTMGFARDICTVPVLVVISQPADAALVASRVTLRHVRHRHVPDHERPDDERGARPQKPSSSPRGACSLALSPPRLLYLRPPGRVDRKHANKDALRDRLLLRKDYKPVIAYAGRVGHLKGVHLIHHAIFCTLASSPDPAVNDRFWLS
jgi:glycosyltransferase involved in cell wall biosynthesis